MSVQKKSNEMIAQDPVEQQENLGGPLFASSLSVLGKRWQYHPFQERETLALCQTLGESALFGRLLNHRGVTVETAQDFLNPTLRQFLPEPFHLLDMEKAVQRVLKAIESKETMAIFGDYDVDGATSSALIFRFLESLGCPPLLYIPHRLKEGYGPNLPGLLWLKDQGAQVIITVDCGTTAFDPLEAATAQGLDVIVMDHHGAQARLPKIHAVVNPHRLDQVSCCRDLAAVGVCFLFVVALNRALRQGGFYKNRPEPDLRTFLDLVALGTVCDVVPLRGLNRAFVSQGLKVMRHTENLGLKALIRHSGIQEERPLDPYHLGFILGPRLNAGGRVGDPSLGVTLLTTCDSQKAQAIAQRLDHDNQQRRLLENVVLEAAKMQAFQQIHDQGASFLCVSDDTWHPGVIGIVAGRLKEFFHRPVAVVSFQDNGTEAGKGIVTGKGSARSIKGVSLGDHLREACDRGLLLKGGGHAMAGGFEVTSEQLIPFQSFMNTVLKAVDLTPVLEVEGDLSLSGITLELAESLERLGPYGAGNPSPRFIVQGVRVESWFPVGSDHLRCNLGDLQGNTMNAMAFRAFKTPLGDVLTTAKDRFLALVGSVTLNTWKGRCNPQFLIEDAHIEGFSLPLHTKR